MSTYSFAGAFLKKIYQQKFSATNISSGQSVAFAIYDEQRARARTGLEAYGVLIDCHHPTIGKLPSFLKIFKLDIAERQGRTDFLVRSGLAKNHDWLFQGVPYAWLPRSAINGVEIIGHVAMQIGARYGGGAEDFGRLKEQDAWDAIPAKMRRTYAAHLCCAVAALETMNIVHGDLSAGNIMIGPGPDGETVCCLCDFDGFHHPSVPPLPRMVNGIPCRPLGTAGYQYPELLQRIAADTTMSDAGIMVETDRFALGTLICEMVVWSSSLARGLQRYELLTPEMIVRQAVTDLPNEVRDIWPQGFVLLDRAANAGSISDMPSPEDWLSALGVHVRPHQAFRNRPYIEFYRRRGNRMTLVGKAALSKADTGDFASVAPVLSAIQYHFTDKKLTLKVTWPEPIFLVRESRSHQLGDGPRDVPLNANDSLTSNFWELRIFDGQPQA